MAQRQIELKELQPKAEEVIPVKVELIDNQKVFTVSNYNHSIQIPLTEETKAEIDALLEAAMGTTKKVKDIKWSRGQHDESNSEYETCALP